MATYSPSIQRSFRYFGFAATFASLAAACTGTVEEGAAAPVATEPTTPAPEDCEGTDPADPGPTPLRRLSVSEYQRSVRDLFASLSLEAKVALPDDDTSHGFENDAAKLEATSLLVERHEQAARSYARQAVAQKDELLPCGAETLACARSFIEQFGEKAFRRPLSSAEVDDFAELFAEFQTEIDFDAALEIVISAFLQAPDFIYRLELGGTGEPGEVVQLDPYEIAARLSYLVWGSLPDAELMEAAETGALLTPEGRTAQAQRMFEDPRAQEILTDFHRQWLELDEIHEAEKDPTTFPEWDEQLAHDVREESLRFIRDTMSNGPGTLEALLTRPDAWVNDRMAALYDMPAPASGWEQVVLPADQYAGLLTRANFVSQHSSPTNASPPLRGNAVMTKLFCMELPDPPDDADTSTPEQEDDGMAKTNRQLFEERTAPELCQGCHRVIDGFGYGFEQYDSIGRFRTLDNELPVDATSTLVDTDVDGPYDGPVELSERLAESDQVKDCVTQNWAHFAWGRRPTQADSCRLAAPAARFRDSSGDPRELLLALIEQPSFTRRTIPTP